MIPLSPNTSFSCLRMARLKIRLLQNSQATFYRTVKEFLNLHNGFLNKSRRSGMEANLPQKASRSRSHRQNPQHSQYLPFQTKNQRGILPGTLALERCQLLMMQIWGMQRQTMRTCDVQSALECLLTVTTDREARKVCMVAGQ